MDILEKYIGNIIKEKQLPNSFKEDLELSLERLREDCSPEVIELVEKLSKRAENYLTYFDVHGDLIVLYGALYLKREEPISV